MQFIKRIQPFFLSFTLIACCLTFQANDSSATAATHTTASWVTKSFTYSLAHDVYKIKPRLTNNGTGSIFSVFSFNHFIKQSENKFATYYKQQLHLLLPQHADYLAQTLQISSSEDDTFIS